MLGLFGTLSMAGRALQTQRSGSAIAGHNLAHVNTPGYFRQRPAIENPLTIPSEIGPQGTGADAVAIRQIRDALEVLVSKEAAADLAETLVRLNQTQTADQAALQSAGKILGTSLLDYLR